MKLNNFKTDIQHILLLIYNQSLLKRQNKTPSGILTPFSKIYYNGILWEYDEFVNDYYATGVEYCDKERVYLFDTYLERHLFHKLYDEVIVSPNENE